MIKALRPANLKITVGEAVITGVAATLAVVLGFEIWTMFVGWIAYFTRGLDWRNGIINAGCVYIGLFLGAGAATILSSLGRPPQPHELFVMVTGISIIVLSSRFLPVFNNLLGIFLGVVTWFASHKPPSVGSYGMLAAAVALGTVAGTIAHVMQRRLSTADNQH